MDDLTLKIDTGAPVDVSGGEDRSIKAGPVGTKAPTLDGGERGDHYEVRFFAAEF